MNRKILLTAALTAAALTFGRWVVPVLAPFGFGAALALSAEPLVGRLGRRMPRAAASGLGMTLVLTLLLALLVLGVAFALREAGRLTAVLPGLARAVRQGMDSMELWLLALADRTPGNVRVVLTDSVTAFFSDGSALMDRAVSKALSIAGNVLGGIPDGFLGFGTGILAAYMISIRLPKLGAFAKNRLPEGVLPALKSVKGALWGYLTAQFKLMAVTFGILTAGFLTLGVQTPLLWAAVSALVDAIPVLGTGTVLIPWALVCLLQERQILGIGLLALYLATWLTRSMLEPRLLGKELGLDPLATLLAMYAGYRFFGFWGLILAPVAAVAILKLTQNLTTPQER